MVIKDQQLEEWKRKNLILSKKDRERKVHPNNKK